MPRCKANGKDIDPDYIKFLLPKLGVSINVALEEWQSYLNNISSLTTLDTLVGTDSNSATVTANVLRHILSDLPCRHAVLVDAYDNRKLNFVDLSEACGKLLVELETAADGGIGVAESFEKLVGSKRFKDRVVGLEQDVRAEEQARLMELRRLMAVWKVLTEVANDGELGVNEVKELVQAMEAVGVWFVDEECDGGK